MRGHPCGRREVEAPSASNGVTIAVRSVPSSALASNPLVLTGN